ncbi:6-carboxytetrahydropterin synthase QueD [Bacillus litorisediminis]|uniref:6-carboxytetrahydropterin synthase QueD n=1 Tax=Bacillus litorisediminis TaxID=2922713 RepID=UPI001FAE7DF5|nr:6-carboxytetrahydropterin synthase QueD [Bacillus litorisediminis]
MIQQIYPSVAHHYTYELNKDMQIAAAHFIPHDDAGVCKRIHGHTYFINITLAGDQLDETGFLVNFKQLKKWIHDRFDHSLLNNDTELFKNQHADDFPTSEVMARKIYELVQAHLDTLPNKPKCIQVFLRETPTSYVIYRPKAGDR